MSTFRAGILALATLALFAYFGFTKANPFSNPYQLHAVFDNASNLKPRSPVRIAGVEVGKVVKVKPITEGEGAARVTMQLRDKALPLHSDAELHVRSRIFLEGNFFIDIEPGSPSAPELRDGATVPVQQTSAPVQFGHVLSTLQRDTRNDLQSFLKEFSKGLEGKGARGFNQSIRHWREAYRSSALAQDATLGIEPDRDIQRLLRGQQRTFKALAEDERALKDLVTHFNVTAGAFAREDQALEASVPALRDTLRTAQPALASLNAALPSLRRFAVDALPGVRSSGPTIDASMPFIRQARALMGPRELRGAAAVLRRYIPSFVALNRQSVGVASEGRALSRCTNRVLVPFLRLKVPNPEEPLNSGQVRQEIQRGFPGLSGESRLSDGINQWFHTSAVPPADRVRPGPPADGGSQPPPRRPDVPCETQEPPDLHAPGGPVTSFQPLAGAATAGRTLRKPQKRVSARDFRDAVRRYQREALPKIERIRERYRRLERAARGEERPR